MQVLMIATYNKDNSVNVMNAAWGTMQARNTVALQLTETHKTVNNIKARKAFTIRSTFFPSFANPIPRFTHDTVFPTLCEASHNVGYGK